MSMSFTVAHLPSSRMARIAGGGAYFLVLILGCWILAGLIWAFHVPVAAPLPALPGYPEVVAARIAGSKLFETRVPGAAPSVPAVTPSFRLIGVFHSNDPRVTRAILQRDGDDRPMVVGSGVVIDSETTVSRITRGQIALSIRGREVPLHLPEETPVAARTDNKRQAVSVTPFVTRSGSTTADEDN